MPLAVAIPDRKNDIAKLISFARENKTSLYRAAQARHLRQVVGLVSWLMYQEISTK
jgi:hypothetical protein